MFLLSKPLIFSKNRLNFSANFPRGFHEASKCPPRGPKTPSKRFKECPRCPKELSKSPPMGAQEAFQVPQRGPQSVQKAFQEASKRFLKQDKASSSSNIGHPFALLHRLTTRRFATHSQIKFGGRYLRLCRLTMYM